MFAASPADSVVHRAFGLVIRSNVRIPGLPILADVVTSAPLPDLEIHLGDLPGWVAAAGSGGMSGWFESIVRDERGTPSLRIWRSSDGRHFHLLFYDGTEFLVGADGARIWGRWPSFSTLEDTATYLLGPVAGFMLLLRGFTPLHASAVAVGSWAVAFLGPAGAGKSTLAAAFSNRGYPILTDDIATLTCAGDDFMVRPAYPRIKLWPESTAALFHSADGLPKITPTWDKRYLQLEEGFQDHALPLSAVYLLTCREGAEAAVQIDPVKPSEALLALLANSYGAPLLDRAMRLRGFRLLSRLSCQVPVRRLTRSGSLARLPAFCDAILADLG